MKTLFVLLIAFAGVTSVQAQKIAASKVPAAVKEAFKKQYPDVKSVTWEIENGNYEASWKKNGKAMSAIYDSNGNLQESEVDIKVNELPAGVTSYIKTHYKGAPIKEASKITKTNGEVNYEAMVNHTDVIFDSNGKYLKELKEAGEPKEGKEGKEGKEKKGKKE
jgi:hypothetical protein